MIPLKIITILFFITLINSSLGKPGFGPGDQEWGYVTVRPKAHMFWWLYYTTAQVNSGYEEKPLVIWIQGGPGVSGVGFGNFEELGPLDAKLNPRNYTWVKDYNVLFIDNPVGTGFSYVESPELYCKDNKQIAKDLMSFIRQFFAKFPKFLNTPTYILTESYGGKVTVEWAYNWYLAQKVGSLKSSFRGIGLIDSLISATDMYKSWAPYLYHFGMIDRNGYSKIDKLADDFVTFSDSSDWPNAVQTASAIESMMQNVTYHINRLDVLKRIKPLYNPGEYDENDELYSSDLINAMALVKQTLGLNSNWSSQENEVFQALALDSRKSVVYLVEKLLNNTDLKVFVFNGQLDVIINTPGTLRWIEKLNWRHSEDWANAARPPLVVNNITEGYSKGYGKFKFYWVHRSGHMIPAGNPIAMEPILQDLIYN